MVCSGKSGLLSQLARRGAFFFFLPFGQSHPLSPNRHETPTLSPALTGKERRRKVLLSGSTTSLKPFRHDVQVLARRGPGRRRPLFLVVVDLDRPRRLALPVRPGPPGGEDLLRQGRPGDEARQGPRQGGHARLQVQAHHPDLEQRGGRRLRLGAVQGRRGDAQARRRGQGGAAEILRRAAEAVHEGSG